jgi:hypothetical protein
MNGNLKNQTIFLTPVIIIFIIFVGAPSATLGKAANGSLVIEPLCKLTISMLIMGKTIFPMPKVSTPEDLVFHDKSRITKGPKLTAKPTDLTFLSLTSLPVIMILVQTPALFSSIFEMDLIYLGFVTFQIHSKKRIRRTFHKVPTFIHQL